MNNGFKVCNTCKIEKHVKRFYASSKGGVQHECRDCVKKKRKKKMSTGNFYNPEETKRIWYYRT